MNMEFINKIYNENCLTGLSKLPENSIDCCVTSPPYFGLRDYGISDQIGMEETPDKFVLALVNVFEQVKRILKPDGTLWLNLGDSYARNGSDSYATGPNALVKNNINGVTKRGFRPPQGLKHKDLIGIPWMVAFALRSAGWYLRQDIIWHKPNPMPESVTDRCTKAHEYIFLLSKSAKYYYDYESIKVPVKQDWGIRDRTNGKYHNNGTGLQPHSGLEKSYENANKRSVWSVTTKPFSDAHFATFPEDLIVDCIKAGCPENGIVLDPFMGAGTTALVSRKLNRNFVGFELNSKYIEIANNRLFNQLGLFA